LTVPFLGGWIFLLEIAEEITTGVVGVEVVSADGHQLPMVLMHFYIGREVGVQAGFVLRAQPKDEVALKVALVVYVRGGSHYQVELQPRHVHHVRLVDYQKGSANQLLLSVDLRIAIG
jgi:hypothetical protein